MGSHDFVTAIKLEKMVGPFLAPCLRIWLFFGSFWTRIGPLAKSRSGNPDSYGTPCHSLREYGLVIANW